MNTAEIQIAVDELAASMLAKCLKQPRVQFNIESDKALFTLFLKWEKGTTRHASYDSSAYEFIHKATPEEAIEKAKDFIAAMPSREDAGMRQFLEAMSDVIELGRENGVDVEFINPLQAAMQKLSANIITDQRPVLPRDADGDDMPF